MRSDDIGIGHAERIGPMAKEVMAEAGVSASDLTGIIGIRGPGSFMGVRVGLSFAAGMALPYQIPTYPLTTLEALWLSAPEGAKGAALIDARRGQVYGQTFGLGGEESPFLLDIADARDRLGETANLTLIGSGTGIVAENRTSDGRVTPDLALVLAAFDQFAPGPLTPLYLRPPDAKPMAPRPPAATNT